MKYLFFGCGAIGSYVGGSLAYSGQNVTFIDPSDYARNLAKEGIHLQLLEKTIVVKNFELYPSLKEALDRKKYDIAVIAIKAFDSEGLASQLSQYKEQIPPILCLQNGVENEDVYRKVLGYRHIIPASVTTAISRSDEGLIKVEKLRGIGISSFHPISFLLEFELNKAGLKPELYENPEGLKWSKLITNLQTNALSAILDMMPYEVLKHPLLYSLESGMIKETVDVMKANSIPVINLPKSPVKLLVWGFSRLPSSIGRLIFPMVLGKGRGEKVPSLMIDLRAGKKTSEVDFLNGAVSRKGLLSNVHTPINDFYNFTLQRIVMGEIPWSKFKHQPEAFFQAYHESMSRKP